MDSMNARKLIDVITKNTGLDYFIIDGAGTILRTSPRICQKITGYKTKLKGVSIGEVFPSFSDSEESTAQELITQEGDTFSAILIGFGKDKLLLFNYHEDPLEMQQLKGIISQINQGIMACDVHGRITLYNQAYGLIDGFNTKDVIGKLVMDVYGMDERTSLLMRVIATRQPIFAHRQQYTTVVGNVVDVVKDVYPLFSGKTVIGAFAMVHGYEKAKAWAKRVIDDALDNQQNNTSVHCAPIADVHYVSETMKKCIERAEIASTSDVNIVISGESGTGKSDFAHYIIEHSDRKDEPVIIIDCAAIPQELIGRLMFGYEEGYAGNAETQAGLLENANGGTIILKNIESMPSSEQAMLQNFYSSGSFYPVGSIQKKRSDIRTITQLTRTIPEAIKARSIRSDLIYSLAEVSLELLPLRERSEDIMPLVHLFMKQAGSTGKHLSAQVCYALTNHGWNGNMAELRNVVNGAILLSSDNHEITTEHLPQYITGAVEKSGNANTLLANENLKEAILNTERLMVKLSMERCGGNITSAAKQLGISRQNLQYRLKKLAIETF